MIITSRHNQIVVLSASLKEKKYRDENKMFLIEGIKLYKEAIASKIEISHVFATQKNLQLCRELYDNEKIIEVSESVLDKISTEKAPQGVICVAKYIDKIHNINKIYNMDDFCSENYRIMILSSIQDPGNLGTIIRTAAAFGIDELILSKDCADIYNPKTVRAAMGTIFKQKISYADNLCDVVQLLKNLGYSVFSAVLDKESVKLDEIKIDKKTVFVIGNEGHGISPELVRASTGKVYIPMTDQAESLNAAVAAAVFMWQIRNFE